MENEALLLRSDADGVVTLTLNRPAQFNALSTELLDALQAELDKVGADGTALSGLRPVENDQRDAAEAGREGDHGRQGQGCRVRSMQDRTSASSRTRVGIGRRGAYFRMQCFAKSTASFADQSPFGLAFRLAHHLSLPTSGAQADSPSKSIPASPAARVFLNVFIAVLSK